MTLTKEEIIILGETFLLHNLEPFAFSALTKRTDLGFTRRFLKAGELLTPEPEDPPSLAVLISGELLVPQGVKLPDRVLAPGFVIGALDLFSSRRTTPPELRARTRCSLLLISAEELRKLFTQYPAIMMNYINFLTGQIQELRRERLLTSTTPEERLGHFLKKYWTETPEGYAATLPFSLSALAERIGLSRAALYRMLDQLEAEGVLHREGKHFTVLCRERLLPE